MLLSRGYSTDEIKVLDDYVFIVRKKEFGEPSETDNLQNTDDKTHRKRRKRSNPQKLVCLTSNSDYYNKKDHTLYSLNGEELTTKGRFVWSIINLYQKENNPTYEEVDHLFNHKLHLLKKTIIEKSSLDKLRPDRQKRYFSYESDILVSKDGIQYVVSNQWSIGKMEEVISFARSNGWKVEVNQPKNMMSSPL